MFQWFCLISKKGDGVPKPKGGKNEFEENLKFLILKFYDFISWLFWEAKSSNFCSKSYIFSSKMSQIVKIDQKKGKGFGKGGGFDQGGFAPQGGFQQGGFQQGGKSILKNYTILCFEM